MSFARITIAMMICVVAGVMFTRDLDKRSIRRSTPGMINANPVVASEIDEATSKVEELMFIYERKLRRAKTPQEIDEADAFYDREVIPAQMVRLKRISRKHTFRYKGLPTPSKIHRTGRQV